MFHHVRRSYRLLIVSLLIAGIFGSAYLLYGSKQLSTFSIDQSRAIVLNTLYGDYVINEPVLIDVIQSPAMQRLKGVRQYGVCYYAIKQDEYSRFDHSIGVFVLVRKYGGSLAEQLAALLHDASHSAFSHLAEWVFNHQDGASSYQDDHHIEILAKTGLQEILQKHGFSLETIHHKNHHFTCLEASLPDICADRLEYNLYGGVLEHLIEPGDIQTILEHLFFEDNRWYFDDAAIAAKFARISLYHTEHVWSSPGNQITNYWAAEIIKRAAELGVITMDDFFMQTDDVLWRRFNESDDPVIKKYMHSIMHYRDHMSLGDEHDYTLYQKAKSRGIDPWIKTRDGFMRLTSLDAAYCQEFNRVKWLMDRGWYLKLD